MSIMKYTTDDSDQWYSKWSKLEDAVIKALDSISGGNNITKPEVFAELAKHVGYDYVLECRKRREKEVEEEKKRESLAKRAMKKILSTLSKDEVEALGIE